MGALQAVLVVCAALSLLCGSVRAGTLPDDRISIVSNKEELLVQEDKKDADLSRSALKGVTFLTAVTVSDAAILSVAAGGIIAGTTLTLFCTGASLVVYTANDYLWGHYAPTPLQPEPVAAFNLSDDIWLTTGAFLTYTASTLWVKALKFASLYAYTVEAEASAVAISATVALNAVYFYTNSLLWDYYGRPALPSEQPGNEPLTAVQEIAVPQQSSPPS